MTTQTGSPGKAGPSRPSHLSRWIVAGLFLGILVGLMFGEYCAPLQIAGEAYVGLLQMTVLPYLIFSLVAKLGRLDVEQAKRLGRVALLVLLCLWLIGIVVVVLVSAILPPIPGASFYSAPLEQTATDGQGFLSRFIPANIFRSLSAEYVPAVIVFCLFFGCALMLVPRKEPLLDFLDICTAAIGRINMVLVRLAPVGLFVLTAAAAGSLRIEQLSQLQAYLILFTLACLWVAFGMLPLLLSSLTEIRYRDVLRAAQEPLLTVIATGKLFVVLPQIVDKCELLLAEEQESSTEIEESSASVLVPMAYPFPHLGKILIFVFVSFAGWYVGQGLTPAETAAMAATGAVSSFASPLITLPYLLDQYQLPQDLMQLFLLPGFITMRLGDMVGVLHLMVFTVIVAQMMQGRLRIQWPRLLAATFGLLLCLVAAGAAGRWYLASTALDYNLDERFLALDIPSACEQVTVYRSRDEVPERVPFDGSTLERVNQEHLLRVGYHPDHLPYCFFNARGHLVGLDVELMHRLAVRLEVRLEFVPYAYDTVLEQLEGGEIDMAVGGLMMKPERLLRAGFTQPYQTATMAVVLADHRRGELEQWHNPQRTANLRLGVAYDDLVVPARRELPTVDIVVVDSLSEFFQENRQQLDGLVIAAEEGSAWNVLYPEYAVVVPRPVVQRPVAIAVRRLDVSWLRFLDGWLEFERMDGSLDRLRRFWVEGGGTQQQPPRWCILRDELHWLP